MLWTAALGQVTFLGVLTVKVVHTGRPRLTLPSKRLAVLVASRNIIGGVGRPAPGWRAQHLLRSFTVIVSDESRMSLMFSLRTWHVAKWYACIHGTVIMLV